MEYLKVVFIEMEDLSLHILDIAENSIAAGAKRVEIRIAEDLKRDMLSIEIKDNGKGMSEKALKKAADPFYTTRTTRRVGLGLSLLGQTSKEAGGEMSITSREGTGTTVSAYFRYSHIDRKPIGSMTDTLITLISGNPDVDFFYEHRFDDNVYSLDTGKIRSELGDIPLNSIEVINLIRNDLNEGLKAIKKQPAELRHKK